MFQPTVTFIKSNSAYMAYMVVLFVGINRTVLREIKLLQKLRHPNIIGVGNRKVIERWDPP